MAFIDTLNQQSQYTPSLGVDLGLPKGSAYSSFFPQWETQTPQYIQQAVYSTEQTAFRINEFVYSIIIKRAKAEAKGHLRVNDITGEEPKEIKDHKLRKLIKHPNKGINENMFWGMKRISQDLAGFSAWEVEFDMLGEPMRLWFMRPDWCSFRRAQQDPLAYIRYQPYGLPYQDIPLVDPKTGQTKILFFSEAEDFDPLFPNVRFYSPAMHALQMIEVDNAASFFLADFFKHGAKTAGILSVQQTIDENTAQDYQRRWMEQHGGAGNWSKPVVLGLGTTYTSVMMNFKDMMFPELDARTETRICDVFDISPIVAEARAGLNVSTYNNYTSAVKDWYYGWVADAWENNGEVISNEMLPIYEGDNAQDRFACDFDYSRVPAMQEDRTQIWTRAVDAWKNRLIKRNDALKEMQLKPIEGPEGEDYYVQATIRDQQVLTPEGDLTTTPEGQPQLPGKPQPKLPAPKAEAEAQASEEKKFRAFAKRRMKEDKPEDIPLYEFKFISLERQNELIAEFIPKSDSTHELAVSINELVKVYQQTEKV